MAQKTTAQNASTTQPWATQTGYLTDAFGKAQDNYNATTGNQYSGNLIAGMTPDQLNTFQSMVGFGNTSGAPGYSNAVAGAAPGTAAGLNSTGAGYNSTAGGLYGLGASTAMQGNRTTGQGVRDLSGSYNQLQGFTPTGGTQDNIAAAQQYANNPAISGMVTAAMRDANRNATEQQLPGIARDAAASGNIGSSKRGLAEGVVTRGLNDQAGDISSQLQGQAYNNGLNLAENARQFNNSASLDALKSSAGVAGNIASTGLGQTGAGISAANAGTSAGGLGLGYAGAANTATNTGLEANNAGLAQQAGLYDIANQGGAGQQQANQLALDNSRSQIEYQNQMQQQALQNYYGIIGGNNWGSTTNGTSSQSTTPSPLTVAAGIAGAGASLMGGNPMGAMGGMGGGSMLGGLFGGGGGYYGGSPMTNSYLRPF